MSRRLSGLVGLVLLAQPTLALDAEVSKPPVVERAVSLQRAMAEARDLLAANKPANAAAVLEAQLQNADGNKAFLGLLRDVYAEELKANAHSPATAARTALVRERLILLGESPPATVEAPARNPWRNDPPAAPAVERDVAREAAVAFQQGRHADAAALFADASQKSTLTADESAAWAYCRLKAAASRVNEPGFQDGSAIEREVAESVALVPGHARVRELGDSVLNAVHTTPAAANASMNDVIETASFRVRHNGNREIGESIAKAVESLRKNSFERWSGPSPAGWEPKCEIVLHTNGEAFAKASGKPTTGTGHASIRIAAGRVAERKIDLRADDAGVVEDALPRELMHVVLADLFPNEPPPRWAEAGMAVLASSAGEVDRYSRTLQRCARNGELVSVASLLEMKDYPGAEKITGFYCESVSLVEFLVKLRGERNFTIFIRDSHRYGVASALKKTYELDGPPALERALRQRVLVSTRAQSP